MGEGKHDRDADEDDEAQGQEVSEHCVRDSRPAVVAVNGVPLCLSCYHQRMQELGDQLKAIRAAVAGDHQDG